MKPTDAVPQETLVFLMTQSFQTLFLDTLSDLEDEWMLGLSSLEL